MNLLTANADKSTGLRLTISNCQGGKIVILGLIASNMFFLYWSHWSDSKNLIGHLKAT